MDVPVDTYLKPAFRHVMAGTTIKPDLQHRLFPIWANAYMSGDPKEEKRCLNELSGSPWAWPLFDKWRQRFAEEGCWPQSWRSIGLSDIRARRAGARRELLRGTLFACAVACRDGERMAAFYQRNGWRLVGIGCPVERAVAAEFSSRVSLDDWTTWPPFFPGDGTMLMGQLPQSKQPSV